MSIFSRAQTAKTILTGLALGAIAAILIVFIGQAQARPLVVCNQLGCSDRPGLENNERNFSARRHSSRHVIDTHGNDTVIIGGRPAGCPRAYCGCGLRKWLAARGLSGMSDIRLNLADNWRRLFPRTHARPGAVAVRNRRVRGYGHVVYLIAHVRGNVWRVRDYNSGRGLSRIHNRSVAGYSFVSPDGGRVAMTSN
jgi:hypothetical protein